MNQTHTSKIANAAKILANEALDESLSSRCAELEDYNYHHYGRADQTVDWLMTGYECWGELRLEELLSLSGLKFINGEMIKCAEEVYIDQFIQHSMWSIDMH